MGRIMGILFMVISVWVAAEVYTEGVDGAFGGLFAGFRGEAVAAPAERTTPDRAADAFQRAYDKSEDRVDRMLEAPGASE